MKRNPPLQSIYLWSMPLVVTLLTTKVDAQESLTSPWDFKLGLGVQSEPDYDGSDDRETMAIPAIEVSYNDRFRFSTLEGLELSGDIYQTDEFRAKIGLGYNEGRKESDNPALAGLGDIKGSATFLAGVKYQLELPANDSTLSFGLDLERDLKGTEKGTELEASIAYTQEAFAGRGFWQIGANATWADNKHMSKSFGITAAQAAGSSVGLSEYAASSGIKSVGIKLAAGYQVGRNTTLIGSVDVSRLGSKAADSPLVADFGSRTQTSAKLGVLYSW